MHGGLVDGRDRLERAAFLTIDMQNDFVLPTGSATVTGSIEVVPALVRLLTAWREARRPIVHAVRLYERDGSNAELGRRAAIRDGMPVAAPGSSGSQLVDALGVVTLDAGLLLSGALQLAAPAEWVMYKPRWGAFFGTGLELHLRSLGIDTLVVCGCNLPNCPRATLFEASERDFAAMLVGDATSQATDARLADLALIHVTVATASEIIGALIETPTKHRADADVRAPASDASQ